MGGARGVRTLVECPGRGLTWLKPGSPLRSADALRLIHRKRIYKRRWMPPDWDAMGVNRHGPSGRVACAASRFEFTCVLRMTKPALARRVQRRASPH